jgi:hypothetical protein
VGGKIRENLRVDFCTFLFAFVPLGLLWLMETARGDQPDWIKPLGTGDVLLITAVLCTDAFGRIAAVRGLNTYYARVIGTVLSGAVLFAASLYFATITLQIEGRKDHGRALAEKLANELTAAKASRISVPEGEVKVITDAILEPPVNYARVAKHSFFFLAAGIAISIGAILMEED